MTDPNDNQTFDPSELEATRGREQGLGVGARELALQRDVGDVVAAPEEERDFQSADQDAEDALDENTSVLGKDDEDDADEEDEEDEEDADDDGAAPVGLPA